MSTSVKAGSRLYCAASTSEFIVVRAAGEHAAITIGGHPAVQGAHPDELLATVPGHDSGAELGKRYVDAGGSFELLCTKPGAGIPAIEGELLGLKAAKALPASD